MQKACVFPDDGGFGNRDGVLNTTVIPPDDAQGIHDYAARMLDIAAIPKSGGGILFWNPTYRRDDALRATLRTQGGNAEAPAENPNIMMRLKVW